MTSEGHFCTGGDLADVARLSQRRQNATCGDATSAFLVAAAAHLRVILTTATAPGRCGRSGRLSRAATARRERILTSSER
jgi:hypothetical protein